MLPHEAGWEHAKGMWLLLRIYVQYLTMLFHGANIFMIMQKKSIK